MVFIEPTRYGEHLNDLLLANLKRRFSANASNDGGKAAGKTEGDSNDGLLDNFIGFQGNASTFCVFSAIRSAIFEAETKSGTPWIGKKSPTTAHSWYTCCLLCMATCKLGEVVNCRCHSQARKVSNKAQDSDTDESEETTQREMVQKVPQIVGAGLRSMFQLIAESKQQHPEICTKALYALLDVIQGQQPESFRSENDDLIEVMYELLLDLATYNSGGTEIYSWSSVACSALIGLCVASGDTGKMLKAISAMLMSPPTTFAQHIQLPVVLTTLQRSVVAVALNRPSKPDVLHHGIPLNSEIGSFKVESPILAQIVTGLQPAIACDGKYLYLLIGRALMKIGSGFGGTLKGHVYCVNETFSKDTTGWLGYANNVLYYRRLSKKNFENVDVVDVNTLRITNRTQFVLPPAREICNTIFSDGESLNIISTKDETLLVKQLQTGKVTGFELSLKLARKTFRTLGYAQFEAEVLNQSQIQKIVSTFNPFEPNLTADLELSSIMCGKEFGLVRSNNGKVFYYGKAAALGLKAMGKNPTLKLTELVISKVSTIVQMSVGHDGLHALLVADDGSVYFAGTARRSEDGDTLKNRRQPKAMKPKKISKIETHDVIYTSCNYGTSALVTKAGKLIMYGKDTSFCDLSGLVTDLNDHHVTKVALGKAHCVVLTSKGYLFTFGLNNKGQCGRTGPSQRDRETANNPLMESSSECRTLDNSRKKSSGLCMPDEHFLVFGQCRICIVCKECTGYNIACVCSGSVPVEERVAGTNCPCGHGSSGCCKCGACATCINYQDHEGFLAKDENAAGQVPNAKAGRSVSGSKKRDADIGSDVERDQPRVIPVPPQRLVLPTNSPVVQIACGLHHTVVLTLAGEVFTFGSNQYGQLGTGDLQPPQNGVAQVKKFHGVVVQVAAGANHTILLNHKGAVYTFGHYQKGQLGRLPPEGNRDQVANVLGDSMNNVSGDAFPNMNKGDMGASRSAEEILNQRQKFLWNCVPGVVTGIGQSQGKKATWIGGSGDQTFLRIDESLVTPDMLNKVNIVADRTAIVLIPNTPLPFECLAINRRDGSCNTHSYNQTKFAAEIDVQEMEASAESDKLNRNVQENLVNAGGAVPDNRPKKTAVLPPKRAFALESVYGNLWMFDGGTRSFHYYNAIASEIGSDHIRAIFSAELALPLKVEREVTRYQACMNLLACLDILTSSSDVIPHCFEAAVVLPSKSKEVHAGDYQSLCRFENLGGGWGYSGHSVEALRFMCDSDIVIGGFSVYGGRGEYSCKLKLYDLGPDGGGYEKDGTLVAETEEVPYECPARGKFNMMLPKPVNASAGRWFMVWAKISGPSSDCGAGGQGTVSGDDQVVFTFKSSKKANNGTDVNSGQIPCILYKVVNRELSKPVQGIEPHSVHKISKLFANTVTKECFDSVIAMCRWSFDSLKSMSDAKLTSPQSRATLERLVYVSRASLRLMRKYINEIYPPTITGKGTSGVTGSAGDNRSKSSKSGVFPLSAMESTQSTQTKRQNSENILLAECVGEVRALLIAILCDRMHFVAENSSEYNEMGLSILEESHITFVACFNAFFPSSTLKWNLLCDLLKQSDGKFHASFLSAVVAGLCAPNVNLRKTFSLLSPHRDHRSIISPSDNSGLPMLSSVENHAFPVLVEQMIYRTQLEKPEFNTNSWVFKDVLAMLLKIISVPILDKVENLKRSVADNYAQIGSETAVHTGLINNCCQLLRRVLGEIVYQSCLTEVDAVCPSVRSILSTGSRYTRTDNTKSWNTGNFGPDAISFSVDKPGIVIAGAMVYSGSGNYDYQLELLQDTMDSKLTSQNRWDVMESVTGSYAQNQVQNDMVEIRFNRPVPIKEHSRYAIRLCSQGAKTCFGDLGVSSLRGPCGVSFSFYPCDLSFNGTTPNRGQLPCIIYYSSPRRRDGQSGKIIGEIHARDIAIQMTREITNQGLEILKHVRELLECGYNSDKSGNTINIHCVDSEHNITPIEEHLDVSCTNRSEFMAESSSMSLATRELTKKFESFTKGIVETLKAKTTNPFDCEIATDIAGQPELPGEPNKNEPRRSAFEEHIRGQYSHYYRQPVDSEDEDGEDEADNEDGGGDSSHLNTCQLLDIFNTPESALFHTLLPAVMALVGPLVNSDPRSTVQILKLIREIIPVVASLNQQQILTDLSSRATTSPNEDPDQLGVDDLLNENHPDSTEAIPKIGHERIPTKNVAMTTTTSNHYCVVESDHPYKSASILTCRVEFPPCVQWFTIEFDSQCGTVQSEDCLNISIPVNSFGSVSSSDIKKCESDRHVDSVTSTCSMADDNGALVSQNKDVVPEDWILIKKFNSTGNWDERSLILPGHRVEFSLQTASNYLADRQTNKFGFKCLVVGYDNPCIGKLQNSSLVRLEHELSYLGGMCCANLLKPDLMLSEDQVFGPHAALLTRGFTLSDSVLTIEQALESHLPIGSHSNERQFLKDFVCCAPGSSGARLAAWLQPESRLDINKCELKLSDEPIHCGWPTQITVIIRDQYGDVVVVPDIKVEMNASPSDNSGNGNRKSRRFSMIDQGSNGSAIPKVPYEATVKDKMCYKAITFMKAYEDYSFEELRFVDPVQSRTSESITAQDNGNGTFSINWTPTTPGLFCLNVIVDGFTMEDVHRVMVKDTGMPPPPLKVSDKNTCVPNKLRQFVAKYSAGLRIRSHPTLQSSQVGVLKMNGVISFIDEVQNDDGTWVRLSTESIRQHVVTAWFPTEAWCLQFNLHLNKTLLFPVHDPELADEGDNSNEAVDAGDQQSCPNDQVQGNNPFLNMSSPQPDEVEDKSTDELVRSQSNLGNTIAGVVEEGANKIQALHKWLKGDSVDLKTGIRRRLESTGCIEGTENRTSIELSEGASSSSPVPQSPLLTQQQKFDYSNAVAGDGRSPTLKRNTFLISGAPTVAEISKQSRRTKLSNLSRHQFSNETASTLGSRTGSFEEPVGVLKKALPPTLAESLRAMFAAFLWQEDIVHDAMACASFLKFHPLLPKNLGQVGGDASVPEEYMDTRVLMTKEEKAQQRHSVEVANAEAYNGQYGSVLDSLAKSGFSSIYNRRRGLQDRQKLQALPEVVTVLPPALRCLVFLWEKLCCKSVEMVQSLDSGPEQDAMPLRPPRNKNEHILEDVSTKAESAKRNNAKKDSEKSNYCELCDLLLPIPVTYHMRSVHPGCGKSSKGKGYNSVGTYCNGWAGNCGEGGKGATSWYLLCEQCRLNYTAQQKKLAVGSQTDTYGLRALTRINMDAYKNMKENALFLLELSNMEPEAQQQINTAKNAMLPKVQETVPETSPNFPGPSHNGNDPSRMPVARTARLRSRKSPVASRSTESDNGLYWNVPEEFNCMQSLTSSPRIDSEIAAGCSGDTRGSSKMARPFSEISFDGVSVAAHASPEVSKFHRSFSMGHGWQNQFNNNSILRQNDGESTGQGVADAPNLDTVVKRRKNRSSCEEDIGSLLLCNPSVNLRSLVPKEVLDVNATRGEERKEHDAMVLSEVSLISRPTMSFIFDRHDLTKLRSIMRRSLRLATCRAYSLQALNWLTRMTTQLIGLHDLMWWFVSALNDPEMQRSDANEAGGEREQGMDHPITGTKLSGHMSLVVSRSLHAFLQTVADLTLLLPAGSPVQQIAVQCFGMQFRQSDHQFLHRSHVFGNISKILSRSDEQQNDDLKFSAINPGEDQNSVQPHQPMERYHGVGVEQLTDLQGLFEIVVSSRSAMAQALVDNSTETFWESDEEDRNKSKLIEVSMLRLNCVCKSISLHVDNTRDLTSRVQTIVFYSGQSLGDMDLIKSIDLDDTQRTGCWITALIKDDTATHFRIVLNGEDATLRVRNIKLMGHQINQQDVRGIDRKSLLKPMNYVQIQQKNCEAATLKVFRLLTGQVFGKLILGRRDTVSPLQCQDEHQGAGAAAQAGSNENSILADSLDMREHMVGILFSRSKLTHLQKQVIVHIVYAIKKEACRAKADWELLSETTDHKSEVTSEASRSTDTYCFEMLSMVLALSGSSVGRSYLSQQFGLLKDLLTLLHVGSDRVQRQVTSLLRRMLPQISPESLAQLLHIKRIPPLDFSAAYQAEAEGDFDPECEGIIDIFLAVIAKALHLQMKVKGATTGGGGQNKQLTTVRMDQYVEMKKKTSGDRQESENSETEVEEAVITKRENSSNRWYMHGQISGKQAENLIILLRDLSMGKLAADPWVPMIKAAVAEAIMNLTRLKPELRTPEECVKTPTLWLALASLCVLDREHVEKLSSSQLSKLDSRPQCANHDDGTTPAMIQCNECSYLCSECDRVLHLNRAKRSHTRTVCKEEEESIRVELRESCGRTKLFWLLALADWKTLKAMVEFRDGNNSVIPEPNTTFVGRCRFCGVSGSTGLLGHGNVCAESQCQEYSTMACTRVRPCGHLCGGVVNEQKCLPCLQYMCQERENENAELLKTPKLTQDADDMCMICFTDALSCAPSMQLMCGHVFHSNCLKLVLEKRWTGPRITFSFCQCPICKADIAHDHLSELLEPILALKNDVMRKALMRLEYEGLLKTSEVTDMISFAMDRYAYYVCFKCQKAYYGGEVRCDAEMGEKFDPQELVCGACSDVARAQMCPKHGTDFLEYKCRYCCSVAVFFCFGTTHFCDTCHDDFQRLTNIPKGKLPKCPAGPKAKQLYGDDCPLHVVHPPTGEEFALGCGICRNAQTF